MTKIEFVDWTDHPVTAEMMKLFTEVRDAIQDKLISGDNLGDEVKTALDVGTVRGLNFFINAEFDEDED